ncbi:hypothetical protein [Kitasatospora sp. McL0602]|uniref:hypothetical protein n=1 Tax=Kitasatospora sp. McL0602 TaxID=3439530 RepID=UPI003F89AE69
MGAKGSIGAAFAALVVLAFFSFGQVALDRLTRNNPQMMMAAGLLVYTTQILLIAVVLALFKHTTLFDTKTFGFTVLGCALIWTGFQVRMGMKAKIYYVQPDSSDEKDSKPGRQP